MTLMNEDHTYNDKTLFRGAIMNSGGAVSYKPLDGVEGQTVYNQVIKTAGYISKSGTLKCLRNLNYTDFLSAVNSVLGILSYNLLTLSLVLSYLPRPNRGTLTTSPNVLPEGLYFLFVLTFNFIKPSLAEFLNIINNKNDLSRSKLNLIKPIELKAYTLWLS
jgi:hypothetical protein